MDAAGAGAAGIVCGAFTMKLTIHSTGHDKTLPCKAASWYLAFITRHPNFPRERVTYYFPGWERTFAVTGDTTHITVEEILG